MCHRLQGWEPPGGTCPLARSGASCGHPPQPTACAVTTSHRHGSAPGGHDPAQTTPLVLRGLSQTAFVLKMRLLGKAFLFIGKGWLQRVTWKCSCSSDACLAQANSPKWPSCNEDPISQPQPQRFLQRSFKLQNPCCKDQRALVALPAPSLQPSVCSPPPPQSGEVSVADPEPGQPPQDTLNKSFLLQGEELEQQTLPRVSVLTPWHAGQLVPGKHRTASTSKVSRTNIWTNY